MQLEASWGANPCCCSCHIQDAVPCAFLAPFAGESGKPTRLARCSFHIGVDYSVGSTQGYIAGDRYFCCQGFGVNKIHERRRNSWNGDEEIGIKY
jgi:hypothetical protein